MKSDRRVAVVSRQLQSSVSRIHERESENRARVLLVGSMISDVQAEASAPSFRMDVANQASSTGKVTHTAGGVCLNIARALRGLGQRGVHIVSAVGTDGAGKELIRLCMRAGIGTEGVIEIESGRTATVLCLFNGEGDVVFSLADVSILEECVNPAIILARMSCCNYSGGIVVTDGDLPSDVLESVCRRARAEKCTVVYDPATVSKAPRCVAALAHIDFLTPNVEELYEIARCVGFVEDRDQIGASACATEIFIRSLRAVDAVLRRGVGHIVLTAGEHGAGIFWYHDTRIRLAHCAALQTARVASVNGAGDCLVAGFVHGLSLGQRKEEALKLGIASAWQALQTKGNVPEQFDSTRLNLHVQSLTVRFTDIHKD